MSYSYISVEYWLCTHRQRRMTHEKTNADIIPLVFESSHFHLIFVTTRWQNIPEFQKALNTLWSHYNSCSPILNTWNGICLDLFLFLLFFCFTFGPQLYRKIDPLCFPPHSPALAVRILSLSGSSQMSSSVLSVRLLNANNVSKQKDFLISCSSIPLVQNCHKLFWSNTRYLWNFP